MNDGLRPLTAVCDAIATLLHPHAEVVLHDLETETVAHIANALSPRRIGDPSLLEELDGLSDAGDVIGPYVKRNPDGRALKSISSVLRDEKGRRIGLLCINLDVDLFEKMGAALQALISIPQPVDPPAALFAADWRERINEVMGGFLRERSVTLSGLDMAGENALLARLDSAGIFSIRNATPYVAELFGWSRSTLYNRLNGVRKAGAGDRS